ncbi:hypothetical protein LQ948_06635 [Jiella sp. MQZ9-1]|uniref:Uncharacterized protein n=1 Tax=Jiella flava TaxID=2816857 RepID=A0A939FWS3_9HYPH|nr:hypothetical protein [Jiella flava]MBO0662289.1 hypothetical protein [Jiella flava]MCD2470880.1 hypothetical protein [Jiella flava]
MDGRAIKGFILIAAFCAGLAPAEPATAQSVFGAAAKPAEVGRFKMIRIDGVVARLDTVTGELVPCRVSRETIVCGKDARAAAALADTTAERDAKRIAALERRVAALEAQRSGQAAPPPPPASPAPRNDTDAAIDKMRQLFEGFAGIVKKLERDDRAAPGARPDDSDIPSPDHT